MSKHGIILLSVVITTELLLTGCGSGGGGTPSPPSPAPSPQSEAPTLFSAAKPISTDSSDSEGPLLGFDASGNITVAWNEPVNGHRELYSAMVSTGGTIRQAPRSLWEGHSFSNNQIASGPTRTYFAWTGPLSAVSGCAANSQEAFFLDPASMSEPSLLSAIDCSPPVQSVSGIDLASSGTTRDQFFAAWSEGSPGSGKVYLRGYSSTAGTFRSISLKVSDPSNDARLPRLSVEGEKIAHLVWMEEGSSETRLGYARTEDGGTSLSATSFVPAPGIDATCQPEIGVGGGRVYIAWLGSDPSGGKTVHLFSSQDRLNFVESLVLPVGGGLSACPDLLVRKKGEAFIAWESEGEIYFTRFQPGKQNPPGPVNVSRSPGSDRLSSSPRIALDGPAVNLVWEETVNGIGQIYFAGSKDGGASFSDPVNLSSAGGDAGSPAIQTDRMGNVSVAWAQGAVGSRRIYLTTGPGARNLPGPFVSPVGINNQDVNKDGVDDLIVGALSDGTRAHGNAYLFLGGSQPETTPEITFRGFDGPAGSDPEDLFGAATALGDINGDGAADVLIGAPSDGNGRGAVYIYLGPIISPNQPNVVIEGIQEYGRMGTALASAGDVNGDGAEDILIGVPYAAGGTTSGGEALLFLGGRFLTMKPSYPALNATDADRVYSGTDSGSQFGLTLAGIGDVNADGYDDFTIGAPSESSNRGALYLFFGAQDLPGKPEKTLKGLYNGDQLGASVAAASDLNGDGYSDFIVGSMNGTATVFWGSGNLSGDFRTLTIPNPETAGAGFGETVSGTGDVNGDGYNDLLIAAPYADAEGRKSAGKVYLYMGGTGLGGRPDRVFTGDQGQDYFGYGAIRIVGDVNYDGLDDILVGASHWRGPGGADGTAYLFFGNREWKKTGNPPLLPAGSADVQFFGQAPGEHFGNAVWRR